MGENDSFVGGDDLLKANNVEVVNLNEPNCRNLMRLYISEHDEEWAEDIGETAST